MAHDFSLTSTSSFYINDGHTTVIFYGAFRERYAQKYGSKNIPKNQWMFEYFQKTSVVEALLVQRWILHILEAEVSILPYNVRKLNEIKRNLIVALYEYHNDIFRYGTAQNILKEGYTIMGVDKTYENLLFKLESIEKLIETAKSSRQERRNVFLNIVIMLLTLVAGLPSANQIVTILSSWKPLPFSSTIATLILYISLVAFVLFAVIWNLWPSDRREKIVKFDQSRPAKTPKFVWPKRVKITALPKIKQKNE